MKRTIFALIAALPLLFSSCGTKEFVPAEGDIVFQIGGESDFSAAIMDATAWTDSVRFDHVAMVAVDADGPYVLEASAKYGVVRTEWADFLASSRQFEGRPGVVVMRLTTDFPVGETMARAHSFIGQEYDWSYYPDNGKMYCSELIYESYLRADGSHIFAAQPMNFLDSGGAMPVFWTELFDRLGEPAPQGIPGTNPNDMSRDPQLYRVYP